MSYYLAAGVDTGAAENNSSIYGTRHKTLNGAMRRCNQRLSIDVARTQRDAINSSSYHSSASSSSICRGCQSLSIIRIQQRHQFNYRRKWKSETVSCQQIVMNTATTDNVADKSITRSSTTTSSLMNVGNGRADRVGLFSSQVDP